MKLVVGNACPRHEMAAMPQECAQCAVREIAVCTALSAPELERLRGIAIRNPGGLTEIAEGTA